MHFVTSHRANYQNQALSEKRSKTTVCQYLGFFFGPELAKYGENWILPLDFTITLHCYITSHVMST